MCQPSPPPKGAAAQPANRFPVAKSGARCRRRSPVPRGAVAQPAILRPTTNLQTSSRFCASTPATWAEVRRRQRWPGVRRRAAPRYPKHPEEAQPRQSEVLQRDDCHLGSRSAEVRPPTSAHRQAESARARSPKVAPAALPERKTPGWGAIRSPTSDPGARPGARPDSLRVRPPRDAGGPRRAADASALGPSDGCSRALNRCAKGGNR